MAAAAETSGKDLLRFLTCGSVDDGKSTLIGRLLHDSGLILDDQLAALVRTSRRYGTTGEAPDLALLVDGLEAERQQGITIDVAYRFFSTPQRSFIVADTPGHEQYTRNMATGASTAELAVILVDAGKGLLPQTRCHSVICALLGIRQVVLAVNKIDLVAEAGAVFARISEEYRRFAEGLGFAEVTAIPVSALHGDNLTRPSPRTPWYQGPTLLRHLETVEPGEDRSRRPFRFPVQWVNRPHAGFRGLAGTIAAGRVAVGDPVVVAGSGRATKVSRIVTFDGELPAAEAGQAVTLVLQDALDIGRGDLLAAPQAPSAVVDQFAARLIWLGEEPMLPGRSYLLLCGTQLVPVRITRLKHRIDIADLSERAARVLQLNDIGACTLATDSPLAFDPYAENHRTGAFILIDRSSNATVGAGMIEFPLRRASTIYRQAHAIGKAERARALAQTPRILWLTGLSGSGKSTIADLVEQELHRRGFHCMLLDGDNLRHGLNRDLGFTEGDRVENIRRVGEVAKLMMEAGLIVICSFISPFAADRQMVREAVGPGEFIEVFVDTPVAECIRRDPKGLYRKALAGEIPNFTGVDAPYEPPLAPELRVDGLAESAQHAAMRLVERVLAQAGPKGRMPG